MQQGLISQGDNNQQVGKRTEVEVAQRYTSRELRHESPVPGVKGAACEWTGEAATATQTGLSDRPSPGHGGPQPGAVLGMYVGALV